jgi:hypothetical protein
VLIGADLEGQIRRIVLLENRETPGFVRRVERAGFLEKWSGLSVAQAAALDVDAVSMATMTSSAIARSVKGRLAMLDGLLLEEADGRPGSGVFALSFGPMDAAILVLVAAAILLFLRVGVLKNPRVFRVARAGMLAASVVDRRLGGGRAHPWRGGRRPAGAGGRRVSACGRTKSLLPHPVPVRRPARAARNAGAAQAASAASCFAPVA